MTGSELLSTPWWVHVPVVFVLVAGAIIRMSRFFTTDTLGGWVMDPAVRWAEKHEGARRYAMLTTLDRLEGREDEMDRGAQELARRYLVQLDSDEPISWQARLVSGLSCPFCVGFHVAWIIPSLTLAFLATPLVFSWVSAAWLIILLALTLNYVLGHISARLDVSHDDEE